MGDIDRRGVRSVTCFDVMTIKAWLLGPLQRDLPTPELCRACRRFPPDLLQDVRSVPGTDADLAALASEVAPSLKRADDDPEQRGLLRALALAGQGEPDAALWFAGDRSDQAGEGSTPGAADETKLQLCCTQLRRGVSAETFATCAWPPPPRVSMISSIFTSALAIDLRILLTGDLLFKIL
jgi:hypothetical protein